MINRNIEVSYWMRVFPDERFDNTDLVYTKEAFEHAYNICDNGGKPITYKNDVIGYITKTEFDGMYVCIDGVIYNGGVHCRNVEIDKDRHVVSMEIDEFGVGG